MSPGPHVDDLSQLLGSLAATRADRPAVVGEHSGLTFTALDRFADAWANGLSAEGVGPGANVGLLAGNGPEWMSVAFGVWRCGATLVPISTFATARELGEVFADAPLRVLILQPRPGADDPASLLDRIPDAIRPPRIVVLGAAATPEWQNADDFRRPGPWRPAAIDPESTACILFTSGTTGRAKGVQLSHRSILATTGPTQERSGLTEGDSLLSTLPLFWVAGLVIRALPTLAAGAALLLPDRFTAGKVIAMLRAHRPTALHLRPPQVGEVLAHPGFEPDLLSSVRRGNGRVHWYRPHLDANTTRFITGYGMTEMSGYVTALHWLDPAELRSHGVGTPLPGVEIRIVDAAGRPGPANRVGEVRVRGPGLFSGYASEPIGTGLDDDGYFLTGDLGRIDGSGMFHFAGRAKELLRVKGINVSPAEVEAVLGSHPAVEAIYVVGVPHAGDDQTVVAIVVARRPLEQVEEELRRLADDSLSRYKRPSLYVPAARGDIPLGGTSKPRRADLAALADSLLDRSRGQ